MTASHWILGLLLGVALLAGLFFLIRSTASDNRQTIDLSLFNLPIGKVSLSLGVVLVLGSIAGAVLGFPALEEAQRTSRIETLEADAADLDATIAAQGGRIAELEGDLNQRDDEIAGKNVRIGELEAEGRRQAGAIGRLEKMIDEKDRLIGEAAETMRTADEELRRRAALIGTLRQELKAAEKEARNAVQVARDIASAANEADLSAREREELRRVRAGIEEIDAGLSRLALREAPLLEIVGRQAVANYEIYARSLAGAEADALDRGFGLFEFESERFTLESHYGGGEIERLLSEIAPALCGAVNASIAGDVSLEDAIRRIPALEKYEGIPEPLLVLADYAYLRLQLQALAVDAEVFVRGYADGERAGWSRPLPSRTPDRIEVHPLANPDAASPLGDWRFLATTEPRPAGHGPGRYNNADLPNLRGLATRDLMQEVVGNCALPGREPGNLGTGAAILEGKLHEQYLGSDRKSRAFVSIGLR